jgi:CubicO group peptidase (beta-lactamase class C family)
MKIQERRMALLKDNLKEAPANTRGKYLYSNLGYMIAGCMAEKLTDSTWESLMQERIFNPLEMSSAGFGPPGSRGKTDQPWGHNRKDNDWNPQQFDNAASMGPAGTVHCSVEDWAKFIAIQLPNGNHLSLSQTQLKKLITPTGTYAGGWIIGNRAWGKGTVLNHNGSNTMWYATVWVAPKTDRIFIVATNSSDHNSNEVCDKMIGKLIEIDRGD